MQPIDSGSPGKSPAKSVSDRVLQGAVLGAMSLVLLYVKAMGALLKFGMKTIRRNPPSTSGPRPIS